MTTDDPIIDQLGRAHAALVVAGKAYLSADVARTLAEVEDACVDVLDLRADLRRLVAAGDKPA